MTKTHKTAIHIKSDGTETTVSSKGAKFTLDELQGFVGGMIELTKTKDNRDMWVNEEGKIHGLPYNGKATALYRYGDTDWIMGDVLVIDRKGVTH